MLQVEAFSKYDKLRERDTKAAGGTLSMVRPQYGEQQEEVDDVSGQTKSFVSIHVLPTFV